MKWPLFLIASIGFGQTTASVPLSSSAFTYIAPFFDNRDDSVQVSFSVDGLQWMVGGALISGGNSPTRDGSMQKISGQWWITHSNYKCSGGGFTNAVNFEVRGPATKVTPSLTQFTNGITVDTSGDGATQTWAPEWYCDTSDGTCGSASIPGDIHVFVVLNTSTIVEKHPTNAAMTTWSAASTITINNKSSAYNVIDPFVFRLNAASTLTGSLTSGATSATIAAALLPIAAQPLSPNPPFVIRIDSEDIAVTALDSAQTTLTITRGVNGTSAASHSNGATVTLHPYWLIFKNDTAASNYINLASSSSLNGPYWTIREGNWGGWGTAEGGSLIWHSDGSAWLYMDRQPADESGECSGGEGMAVAVSRDFFRTWQPPLPFNLGAGSAHLNHGTVVVWP